jgi:hypothetical protein
MNEVQLSIVVIIAVIVLAIIIYYIYQEHKFKKIIEANFNQAADDVIKHDQGLVFENQADFGLQGNFRMRLPNGLKTTQTHFEQCGVLGLLHFLHPKALPKAHWLLPKLLKALGRFGESYLYVHPK